MNGVALVEQWVSYFCGRGPNPQDIANGQKIDAGLDTWQNRLAEIMACQEAFNYLGEGQDKALWVSRCLTYLMGREPTPQECEPYYYLPPTVDDYTFQQYKNAATCMIAASGYSPYIERK